MQSTIEQQPAALLDDVRGVQRKPLERVHRNQNGAHAAIDLVLHELLAQVVQNHAVAHVFKKHEVVVKH